jgi:alkanesulfonate monooxygenase SsuD/methylene tetrahydromethanopterin reductase-like flavin-dependent oxidoreductase (luciferase family)
MPNGSRPLAVALMPLETRRDTILDLATRADDLGYEAMFLPETWSHDVLVVLTEVAVRTQRLRLGSGILGIWGRSAAQLAMAASTLDTLSNGRFILGLGTSTAALAEGFHDVAFRTPIGRLRQVITQVQALLRGERIPLANATEARALRLNLSARPELPVWVAGLAPKTIHLTGEVGDGWLPFLYARDRLGDGVDLLQEGTARRVTPGVRPRVCPMLPTVVAEDEREAREGAAWYVAFYLLSMGPLYQNALARQGFEREVQAVMAANSSRGSTVVPPEAESLLEQLTIYGTPERARAQLDRWVEAGADLPILMFRPNLTSEQLTFELDALRP